MMQCHEARKLIPKLIDGLLDYDREFAVRQHINGCPDCQAALHAYERDEQALTGYIRQAPYAPVARDVMDELERQRSPWWDAFMAGSYRLASVAGLVLVILVVGAGAWMLREVATGPTTDDEPAQEVTIGTVEEEEEGEQVDQATEPNLIGEEDIGYIIDQLDEHGLVYELNAGTANDDFSIDYERVAFERHFTLVEYRADISAPVEINLSLDPDAGTPVTYRGSLSESSPSQGWIVLQAVNSEAEIVQFAHEHEHGDSLSTDLAVDLSAIPDETDVERYAASDYANGVEVCCLEIERGVAVAQITWGYDVVDQGELIAVDSSLQPLSEPADVSAVAEVPPPNVRVDGEPVYVLDTFYGMKEVGSGYQTLGVYALPESGELEIEYEYLTLATGWDSGIQYQPMNFQGPWTLTAQLEDPGAAPEMTPTPEPTEPPMVADAPTPAPEPEQEVTPSPTVEEEEDEHGPLRVLVYMVRGDELGVSAREIEYTRDVATASIQALLSGPDYEDQDAGLHSEIPAGTELLDISLEDGTLIVDLSSEFTEGGGSASILMRLAQVVHTGTQFSSVEDVRILIEGSPVETIGGEGAVISYPMDREDFEDQAPAILIETPAPHETVGEQIHLRGTSNTFEANLQIEIIDPAGNQIYRDFATASAGTGTRGEFDLTIPVEFDGEGIGAVRMFEHSARDGERINVVTIPVRFER